jgi:hypothetical protein
LDSFWRRLTYSLHLLIRVGWLNSLPIDYGGRLSAKGGMGALVVVEIHPFPEATALMEDRSTMPRHQYISHSP